MTSGARDERGVLVIGACGLIGRQVTGILAKKGLRWRGTFYRRPAKGFIKFDIVDPLDVEKVFLGDPPRAVFHCANLAGGVDFCEMNPGRAAAFHLDGVREIGNWCRKVGAALICISTDYIFDGTKGLYKEEDPPNPLNVYGKLKLQAERWMQDNLDNFLIVRTTNVYGWDPDTVTPNYVMGLYRALKDSKPFNAPSFLWGQPTYVDDLAGALVELWARGARGIFHVVGPSFVNRFEWALKACEILGLDRSKVREAKEPPPSMIPRPLKSGLDTHKFTASCKTALHDVSGGLAAMKSAMRGLSAPR
jgi:dTDP-4-dehydrorhamnose reductase